MDSVHGGPHLLRSGAGLVGDGVLEDHDSPGLDTGEEVARAFGVQPFMIGHTEKTSSWGTGVEAMGAGFVRYTLRDHLNAFQNEINRKFFSKPDRMAEFDTMELERGDMKSMFEAVRIALGRAGEPAFVSLEEARTLLRLPRKMTGTVPEAAPAPGAAANTTTGEAKE